MKVHLELALAALYEHFLDMDLEDMCDELGISQEEILARFKEKVYAYKRGSDVPFTTEYDEFPISERMHKRGLPDDLNLEEDENDAD